MKKKRGRGRPVKNKKCRRHTLKEVVVVSADVVDHSRPFLILPSSDLEAFLLTDGEGLHQAEAAARMGVSQTTLNGMVNRVRRALAEAVVSGGQVVFRPTEHCSPSDSCPCEHHRLT